jgi:hypothetical protein
VLLCLGLVVDAARPQTVCLAGWLASPAFAAQSWASTCPLAQPLLMALAAVTLTRVYWPNLSHVCVCVSHLGASVAAADTALLRARPDDPGSVRIRVCVCNPCNASQTSVRIRVCVCMQPMQCVPNQRPNDLQGPWWAVEGGALQLCERPAGKPLVAATDTAWLRTHHAALFPLLLLLHAALSCSIWPRLCTA